MKILWFSITPSSLYNDKENAGGWIESLERIINQEHSIELSIAFEYQGNIIKDSKIHKNGVNYYPIFTGKRGLLGKIIDKYTYRFLDNLIICKSREIINKVNPDIIHVFGSEWCYGLLYKYTDKPIVIHIQGCWPPYENAQYPPGFSYKDELLNRIFKVKSCVGQIFAKHLSSERSNREIEILKNTQFFMGRTRWDKALTEFLSPNSRYFYCSEALRDAFIRTATPWKFHQDRNKKILITVGGGHYLKGGDLALKTSKLLKSHSNINFEWRLVGTTPEFLDRFKKVIGIDYKDVNVIPCGNLPANIVQQELLNADLYVHTSYIDNSPNSICEAQYLGLPIITTFVGGTMSLFSNTYNAEYFIPANDPYYLASKIIKLLSLPEEMKNLGENNMQFAQKRHSPLKIKQDILNIYNSILNINNK